MKIAKKIVLLGYFGVGKTSIIRQFVTNEFSTDYKVTIGVHILKKDVVLDENYISLILWDIEGTDDLNQINAAYLNGSHAFVFVYDICRPATYTNLLQQIDVLKKKHPNPIIKIIGNKVDLITQAETSSEAYETIIGHTDYLTSAKTGENVEALFKAIAEELT